MHAIKGGWVGQTFALAKSNESEGRKSRIRRSKEERKAMVESFIKKYQKLNNGSFPSLNLTHKEVGGSFYTVREIVRDIIQENRVLGPAKLTQEKQSTHQLEQDPLGSIALEPQHLSTVLLNGPQFVTNEYQISEEPSSVSGGHQPTPEHQTFDNWQVIDGTQIDTKEKGRGEPKDAEMPEVVEVEQNVEVKQDEEEDLVSDGNHASPRPEMVDNELTMNGCLVDMRSKESGEVKTKESHELIQKELQVNEASKAENAEVQSTTSRSKVTPIAGNVQVETFPVRPISGTNELDGRSGKVTDMANSFSDQGTQKVELVTSAGSFMTGKVNSPQNSRLLDEKEATKLSNPPSDKHCGLMDEEVVEEQLNQLLESSNCSNEGAGHEIQDLSNTAVEVSSNDVASVTSEQSSVIAGAKAVNAPNGMKKKYADHGNGTIGQSKTEEELIEKESDVQQSGHPQKESSPTLDRINLESWDGASKNSGRPRGNPLWAVFKAFIDAFVKFWSE